MLESPADEETELSVAADQLIETSGLLKSVYFEDLVGGTMSREEFVASQQQFFFAVQFFSRPLAALTARMPSSKSRQVLMHNLAEEHGWDDEEGGKFTPSLAHDRTFLAFLASLGARESQREGAVVGAFNLALLGACMAEPPELAYATLGFIEYAFADISAIIGKAVVDRGWITQDALVHYKLHAEIDKRHAAELFAMSHDAWSRGGKARENVQRGVELGCHIFHRLYTDLRFT